MCLMTGEKAQEIALEQKWREDKSSQVWHSGKDNSQYRHGMRNTRIYKIWTDMKRRCDSPVHAHYDRYGGRGIKYCEKWKDFMGFFEDMGHKPPGTFLDREDNNKGYSKENCKWVSGNESMFNRNMPRKNGLPRGVQKSGKRFRATIRINNIRYALGSFATPEEASLAYQEKCLKCYGKIAPEEK